MLSLYLNKTNTLDLKKKKKKKVCRLAGVQFVSAVNSRWISDVHSLVTVQMKEDAREFTVVDIGTILGQGHLIPEGDRRWIVNSRIDLRTFNEVY